MEQKSKNNEKKQRYCDCYEAAKMAKKPHTIGIFYPVETFGMECAHCGHIAIRDVGMSNYIDDANFLHVKNKVRGKVLLADYHKDDAPIGRNYKRAKKN